MRRWLVVMASFLGAAAYAWVLSSAAYMSKLDWDGATHIYRIDAAHGVTWTAGYTAHMALMPLYTVVARIGYLLGASTLDAVRLVHVLCVGAGAAFLAALLRRWTLDAARIVLVCATWLAAVDTVFLIRTIEDDCVTIGWQAAIVWLLLRAPGITVGRALVAGALVGLGSLTNYAVIVWLPLVLLWTNVWDEPSLRARCLRVGAVVSGFAAAIFAWGAWLVLAGGGSWAGYRTLIFASPNSAMNAPTRWGNVIPFFAGYLPYFFLPRPLANEVEAHLDLVTILVVGAALALGLGVIWPWRRGRAAASPIGRSVSLLCLAGIVFSLPTALKGDNAVFERLVHLPLIGAVLIGLWMARAQGMARRVWRHLPVGATGLLLAVHLVGIDQISTAESWLGKVELARRQHPDAPIVVFAESEFFRNGYDPIVSARFVGPIVVLSPKGASSRWPIPPPGLMSLEDWRRGTVANAYLSPAARKLTGVP